MSDSVVKFYQFKLLGGTNEADFLNASQAMDRLLLEQPGFIYRSLVKVDVHLWQDIVYWADAQLAARAEFLMSKDATQDFVAYIDVSSMVATQAKVYTQVYPEMKAAKA